MRDRTVVVMFCGPHDEGEKTPTRRIDTAITLALKLQAPLFIGGDAYKGADIEFFRARASNRGVARVIPAFNPKSPRSTTLGDAQAVVRELEERNYLISKIFLATDWWHLERAKAILLGEINKSFLCDIRVLGIAVPKDQTPDPEMLVIRNEFQGLEDYLAGRYGQRIVDDPLPHVYQPNTR